MRFLLLSNDSNLFDITRNCIKENKESEVIDLIGKQSFTVSYDHSPKGFGQIVSIGSCFLYNKRKNIPFFPEAIDAKLDVDFSISTKACINGKVMDIPQILIKEKIRKKNEDPRFSGKDYLEPSYFSLAGDSIKESDLFEEDARIGIDKNYSGIADDAAFYKQISYRLKKEDFCFAFEIEVKDGVDLQKYNKQLVKLGADASSFVFEAKVLKEETKNEKMAQSEIRLNYPESKDKLRVALISDTYIGKQKMENECNIRYAITNVRPFRFLSTPNSTNPQDYNMKYRTYRSEKRYDLYKAGSVFYFETEAEREHFCKVLDHYKEFKQIGYNNYSKNK